MLTVDSPKGSRADLHIRLQSNCGEFYNVFISNDKFFISTGMFTPEVGVSNLSGLRLSIHIWLRHFKDAIIIAKTDSEIGEFMNIMEVLPYNLKIIEL